MIEVEETQEELEALSLTLNRLVEHHKDTKRKLPKKSKSRKWAIWLLQGAALAITRDAIDDSIRGNKLSSLTHLRLMSEIVDNIVFFAKTGSHDKTMQEQLDGWFEKFDHKKAVYRPFTSDTRGPLEIKTDNLHLAIDYKKEFNHYLSQYAHASYALVDNLFQYSAKAQSLDFYSIENTFQAGRVFWCSKIVAYAVLAIYVPHDIFDYDSGDVNRLGMLVNGFWPDNTPEDSSLD